MTPMPITANRNESNPSRRVFSNQICIDARTQQLRLKSIECNICETIADI